MREKLRQENCKGSCWDGRKRERYVNLHKEEEKGDSKKRKCWKRSYCKNSWVGSRWYRFRVMRGGGTGGERAGYMQKKNRLGQMRRCT